MLTVLDLARDVSDDIGLGMTRPETLFGAYDEGDSNDRKLLRGIVKCLRFLHQYHPWQVLRAEAEFVSVAGKPQPGALPPDFDRMTPGSLLDTVSWRPGKIVDRLPPLVMGALPPGPLVTIRGLDLELIAPSPAGTRYTFEYIRRALVRSGPALPASATSTTCKICRGDHGPPGVLKPSVTCDRDEILFDDELVHLGVMLAVAGRLGTAGDPDYQAFLGRLGEMTAKEGSDTVLSLGGTEMAGEWWHAHLPHTPWGG